MEANLNNSQNQTCPRCESSDVLTHEREFLNGTRHIELRCINGHFIKFVSQGRPITVMPFGKHKGELIREFPNAYLNWILENATLKGSLLRALEAEYERRGVTA